MSQVDTLDTERLAAYLEANVAGFKGPITADKFEGGQSNPTFHIKAASGEYVLRRQPPGKLLKSAHAVDREFRVMNALQNTDVPVPRMYHLCEDRDVVGSMFYIMEFCQGRIFWDAAIPEVDNAQRTAMYDEMNRVLAALHGVDVDAVGLADYGKPGNYFERQMGRWSKQYRASEINHIPAMEDLMAWLEEHLPADDGQVSLVHGDYRLDNMMWHPEEPRVIAVLDWELSTLGHPLADLAHATAMWHITPEEYGGLMGADLKALGIPERQQFEETYLAAAGFSNGLTTFHHAFALFRWAVIFQGIAKRAESGNAASENAATVGALAVALGRRGAELLSGDRLSS